MLPELRRCIQHISLSPDSINTDEVSINRERTCNYGLICFSMYVLFDELLQAVAPLMKYLDDTLVILNESLVKENLTR